MNGHLKKTDSNKGLAVSKFTFVMRKNACKLSIDSDYPSINPIRIVVKYSLILFVGGGISKAMSTYLSKVLFISN